VTLDPGKGDLNPWLSISASDYEGHMGDPGVKQLQFLSGVFKDMLERYRPASVAVPGCTTGNGFEHIDPRTTQKVIGIDINPDYLSLLEKRFRSRIPGLELLCGDIAACALPPRSIGLVHCALILEYVEPESIVAKAVEWLAPGGVLSVVLQLPGGGHGNVTPTEFTSLERLDPVMRLVPPGEIDRLAAAAGFSPLESRVETLESGKQFHVAAYRL
jgi:SAM-dependent methyltransferase